MMVLQKLLMLLVALLSFTVTGSIEENPSTLKLVLPIKPGYEKYYEHTQTRLPAWEKVFKKYAHQYDIPWTLLAAVAYQESKWDNTAVSHTGVKGMMQITKSTAEHIGVDDREDPVQSIRGGAYYLKYLYDKAAQAAPPNTSNYEKWTQALAAYNMGFAHLRDARLLALELKKNPYRWKEFKKVLPALEDENYYAQMTFGYARGKETVKFVDKVMRYYRLLDQANVGKKQLTSTDFQVNAI